MKNLFGAGGISHQTGRIAGTSLCLPNRNGAASASLDCGNHFAHGITRSSSKIESSALPTVKNVGESEVVRRGQICYVGVISDCSSVWRSIVGAEDFHERSFTCRGSNHLRY